MIELNSGEARCIVLPEMGAALASLTVGRKPVLRSSPLASGGEPFALACNLMVPFSNRIKGGFTLDGVHHKLEPNRAGEPYAIHGDGFQKAWTVLQQDHDALRLKLSGGYGPLIYDAVIAYSLNETSLTCVLTLTSRAEAALPFGGGFHPWFPRSAATRLQAGLGGFWPSGPDKLPTTTSPQPIPEAFNFNTDRPLPESLLDNGFSGWDGKARITQGSDAVSVTVTSAMLDTAIIFAPAQDADFFCFEPVSHPINAHNLPGMPGLKVLKPGAALQMDMVLAW